MEKKSYGTIGPFGKIHVALGMVTLCRKAEPYNDEWLEISKEEVEQAKKIYRKDKNTDCKLCKTCFNAFFKKAT